MSAAAAPRPRVAYVVSRFPKLTETFVVCEILALEAEGIRVEIYPLQRERARTVHPEALPLVERAHWAPLLSRRVLRANLALLLERPRDYFGTLLAWLRATRGSARYFLGALAFYPKAVYFARHMRDAGVDHVHAHFASHPAAAAFAIRRLAGIPYSFTAHGSDLHRDRCMLRQKVEEAEFVVAISRFNRDVIAAECGPARSARVVVIHCGVDTEFFRPHGARADVTDDAPFTIVCTGTLHEVKGQTHLLEACRLLDTRGVDFRCLLIGDGPDRAALERQASRAGIRDRVRFLGPLGRARVAEVLREADALAQPSVPTADGRREGLPVALMEAAASGLPIVASRLSGIPELVEDGRVGFLVPPGDPFALADALQRLALDPALRQELGLEARKTALREFDLHVCARELAERFRGTTS